MKRIAFFITAFVLLGLAWVGWRRTGGRAATVSAAAAMAPAVPAGQAAPAASSLTPDALTAIFPTGPAPCPDDADNLAGIEGWAPGAASASKMARTNVGNLGGFGGALGGGSDTPAASQDTCTGITPGIAEYFDRVRTRAAMLPAASYDPAALAGELGDAAAAFAFVRDRIRTEAYAGSMRGAAGTLQARGGSPLDKAALLAALLQKSGVPVQFVHAPLADSDVERLVNAVAASALPPPVRSAHLAEALEQAGVTPASRTQAAANADRVDAGADRGIQNAQAPVARIAQILADAKAPLATTNAAVLAGWREHLRDHWWLRVQQDGAWVDWDPALPDAQPGSHLGAAPTDDASADVSAAQKTAIAVRIIAESSNATGTKTLVESSSTVDAVTAVPIAVSIGDRGRGSRDIAAARSFTPAVAIAGSETTGEAFALDPEGGPRVTVLRLQIETTPPGGPRRLVTRTLLDRRDGGADVAASWTPERSAYAATSAVSMLVLAGDLDPLFAAAREADGLKALRAFIAYVAAGGYGRQQPPPGMAPAYPVEALHYFEQDAIVRRRLEASSQARFFSDRPQIVMMRRALAFDGTRVNGVEQFDIVDNGMAAIGPDAAAAVRANATRGYLDTVIEQHLLAVPTDGGAPALFAEAARGGAGGSVVTKAALGGIAIRIAAPSAARPHRAWWQVDPATGNLVGRMDDGAWQGLAEYAIARANDWSTLYAMLQFYGDFFRCIAGAVEGPLAGREAGSAAAQNWFKQCAGAALCSYLEALTMSEVYSRMDDDVRALIYNMLDLSIPGTKDSWAPSLGYACGKVFTSPLG